MDDINGILSEAKKMKDMVNRADWQQLRKSLKKTWNKTPEYNCDKLRSYIGPLSTAEEEKLRIVMNYLTGTGFRTGKISHKCVQALRDDISAQLKIRKDKTKQECLNTELNNLLTEKLNAVINNNELLLLEIQEKEKSLLQSFVEDINLSVTCIKLYPFEIKKLLSGKTIQILRWGRDQDKYIDDSTYWVQNINGKNLEFKIYVTKKFISTLDELERRGLKGEVIDKMYEHGVTPNDQIDVLRIKKIDQ